MTKRFIAFLLAVGIAFLYLPFTNVAYAYSDRVYGADRYKTAVAISQRGWSSSYYAVLARGDDFPDALCAGPLAQKYNAPILLTEPGSLNYDVLTELRRLGVSHVFIVGGTGAVSQNIEYSLRNAGITTIERIYGSDRYETSVRIAERLGWPDEIVLATGDNFPDALSISSIASKKGMPILLTQKYNIPYSVTQYLQNKSISSTYVVGGVGVISDGVRTSMPNAVRLGGSDRYDTNVLVMKQFENEFDFSKVYVAVGDGPNGNEFADALTGAVLAAKTSSPLVLTGSNLPWGTSNYIRSKMTSITDITALGGEGAVPSSVVDNIGNYTGPTPGYTAATYNSAGVYGPSSGMNTITGDVAINTSGVTLQNTIIQGNLFLGEGIGTGSVYLSNVTISGTTTVRGGGPNTIDMYNFSSQSMIVNAYNNDPRLLLQGSSNINSVTMQSGGRLEERNVSGNGFLDVTIINSSSVYMSGNFDSVYVRSRGANVNVSEGSISSFNVGTSASSSRINISSGAYIDSLTLEASTNVYGLGHIYTANINASGSSIASTPSNTIIRDGIGAYIGGDYTTDTPYDDYDDYIGLRAIDSVVYLDIYDIFDADDNIYNSYASLVYKSSSSKVTVDRYTGEITSSTPGAEATITVSGSGRSTSFKVHVTNYATVSNKTELSSALGNSNITRIKLASDITNLTAPVTVSRAVTIDGQDNKINAGLNITGRGAVIKNLNVKMAPTAPASNVNTTLFGNATPGEQYSAIYVRADNVELNGVNIDFTDSSTAYTGSPYNNAFAEGITIDNSNYTAANAKIINCTVKMTDSSNTYATPFIGLYLNHATNAAVTGNNFTNGYYGIGIDMAGASANRVTFGALSGNTIGDSVDRNMYIEGATSIPYGTAAGSLLRYPGSASDVSVSAFIKYFADNNTDILAKKYWYSNAASGLSTSLIYNGTDVSTGGSPSLADNITPVPEAGSVPTMIRLTFTPGNLTAGHKLYASNASGSAQTAPPLNSQRAAATYGTDISSGSAEMDAAAGQYISIVEVDSHDAVVAFKALQVTSGQLVTANVKDKAGLNSAIGRNWINTINLMNNINDLTASVTVDRAVAIDGKANSINVGLNITGSSAVIKSLKITMAPAAPASNVAPALFGNAAPGEQYSVIYVRADNVELNGVNIDFTDSSAAYTAAPYDNAFAAGITVDNSNYSALNAEVINCTVKMAESTSTYAVPFMGLYLNHATNAAVTGNSFTNGYYGIGINMAGDSANKVSFTALNGNTIGSAVERNMYIYGDTDVAHNTADSSLLRYPNATQDVSADDFITYFEANNSALPQEYYSYFNDTPGLVGQLIYIGGSVWYQP